MTNIDARAGARRQRPPSARLRWRVLADMERRFEPVMAGLGLLWLVLFIIDFVHGLDGFLSTISTLVWVLFILDFGVRLLVAPDRWTYLKRNWLTAISLALPALRVLRIAAMLRVLRAARAARGVRLLRAVTSMNRGMHALGRTLKRRGIWYIGALSAAVTFAGAAGMYALEPHAIHGASGFTGYGDALWWTSMIMTTLGSAYWPQTGEGRMLAFLISLYAIGVFGYITASLASFLVGREAASPESDVPGAAEVKSLMREIAAMRKDLQSLRGQLPVPASNGANDTGGAG
jgi:voltage-gated potassium channel